MKCTEARAVRWPEVRKFYRSLTLLHFPTGKATEAQNVSVDTVHRKWYGIVEFSVPLDKITTSRIY